MSELKLAALGMERRTVALALFTRTHIEEMIVHHIPADLEKALNSLTGFFTRAIELHAIEYVALAGLPAAASFRLQRMHDVCLDILHKAGVPCAEIAASDLFTSYGHPPLKQTEQLRRIGRAIWPVLHERPSTRSSVDAALLGLHVQTDRLLNRCLEAA